MERVAESRVPVVSDDTLHKSHLPPHGPDLRSSPAYFVIVSLFSVSTVVLSVSLVSGIAAAVSTIMPK